MDVDSEAHAFAEAEAEAEAQQLQQQLQQQQQPQLQQPQPALHAPPPSSPSFGSLPASLRQHIFLLALTHPRGAAAPLSCVFWVDALPQAPYLLTGVFPEHWEAHWRAYAAHRQPAARALCAVSREARRVVLDALRPVWSEAGLRAPGLGARWPFLWLDPRHDKIYCKDPTADLPALMDRAREAVIPQLQLHLGPAGTAVAGVGVGAEAGAGVGAEAGAGAVAATATATATAGPVAT